MLQEYACNCTKQGRYQGSFKKQFSKAVTRKYYAKKMLLKFLQSSKEKEN